MLDTKVVSEVVKNLKPSSITAILVQSSKIEKREWLHLSTPVHIKGKTYEPVSKQLIINDWLPYYFANSLYAHKKGNKDDVATGQET